jgi:hypothetical protein
LFASKRNHCSFVLACLFGMINYSILGFFYA